MKYVSSNGRVLEVRDVGPVIFRLTTRPGGPPIKHNGDRVVEDDEARRLLRGLLDVGMYDGGRVG